jgi:hypothetical protein
MKQWRRWCTCSPGVIVQCNKESLFFVLIRVYSSVQMSLLWKVSCLVCLYEITPVHYPPVYEITPVHYPLPCLLPHPCYSTFCATSLRLVPLDVGGLAASQPFPLIMPEIVLSIFLHRFFISFFYVDPWLTWVSDLPISVDIPSISLSDQSRVSRGRLERKRGLTLLSCQSFIWFGFNRV